MLLNAFLNNASTAAAYAMYNSLPLIRPHADENARPLTEVDTVEAESTHVSIVQTRDGKCEGALNPMS